MESLGTSQHFTKTGVTEGSTRKYRWSQYSQEERKSVVLGVMNILKLFYDGTILACRSHCSKFSSTGYNFR